MITIQKTLTEHARGKRFDKGTDKWIERCNHDDAPHTEEYTGARGKKGTRRVWHEVAPPRTVPYNRSAIPDMPFRGGTVHRDITVTGGAEVTLTEAEVERIVGSLVASHGMNSPDMATLDIEGSRRALRTQLAIEQLLLKLGADESNLNENLG